MNWMNSILRRLSVTTHTNHIGGGNPARHRRERHAQGRLRPLTLEFLEDRVVLNSPTTLDVSAPIGTYGGTATLTAHLSSGGSPIAGEAVDLMLGATDLGLVFTNLNGDATIPLASLAGINVGTYIGVVTASFAGDVNFDPSSGSNDLMVTPAPLTITASDQSKTYGGTTTFAGTEFTTSTLFNGDTVTGVTLTSAGAAPTATVAGSPYAIAPSAAVGTGLSNYSISYVSGNLAVTPAALTITADNQTKVYGAAVPTLSASYTGFVNGDTPASLIVPVTLTTTATSASHVAGNPYAITASGAVDSNYTISYVDGLLSVTAAPLTITADNQAKVYGAAVPALTASYTGFVNGDTSADLITPPTLTTTATSASHVAGSPYAITASGAAGSDYTISYVGGSLSVTAAPLTVTADNQTKVYGDAVPPLTVSYTGFVNGDDSTSLTTLPTLTTTATSASHVAGNPYAIIASGAAGSDYAISYVGGSLSVTAAPLTITADNQTKVEGAAVPALTASFTGFVNGDTSASLTTAPTLTTTATSASPVGAYAITASGAVDSDYTITHVAGSLAVTAAPAPAPMPPVSPPTVPPVSPPTVPPVSPPTVPPVSPPTVPPTFVVSAPNSGPDGTEIKVFDPATGQNTRTVVPFAGFAGAVDVTTGDLNGDGVPDVVVGAGATGGPRVRIFDGATGAVLADFFAFSEQFVGGVNVTVGDVDGDGTPDLIVAAGAGGGPHVKVFDGQSFAQVRSFYAYAADFTGGVKVAAGDVDGDGKADIITGTGPGGGPNVRVFSGADLNMLRSFYAFAPTFGGGVNVAAGDVNGDGFADVVTGAGAGGSPTVTVFDGKDGSVRGSFLAFDGTFAGGVRVGVTDADGDGLADIVAAAGPGGGPNVRVFGGQSFALLSSTYAFGDDQLGGVSVS